LGAGISYPQTYPAGTNPAAIAFDGSNLWVTNYTSNVDLSETRPTPRTENLVASAVQLAERIMRKVDNLTPSKSLPVQSLLVSPVTAHVGPGFAKLSTEARRETSTSGQMRTRRMAGFPTFLMPCTSRGGN